MKRLSNDVAYVSDRLQTVAKNNEINFSEKFHILKIKK